MSPILSIFLAWIAVLSLYAFMRMGWDKRSANRNNWRTSEKHFFVIAAIGGTLGVLLGMQYWRHKTQKWPFKGPVYAIFTTQLLLFCLYVYYFCLST